MIGGLAKYDIPREWINDFKSGLDLPYSTPDSNRGRIILEMLVDKRYGGIRSCDNSVRDVLKHMSVMSVNDTGVKFLEARFPEDTYIDTHCPSEVSDGDALLTANDETAIREILLPPGAMDNDTKNRVLAAQRRTPRFLFQGWCASEAHPSGGDPALNTVESIKPFAFYFNRKPETTTLYDLSLKDFRSLTQSHLRTSLCESQFSSWASSLQVAIYYGGSRCRKWGCKGCHISIVDIKMLKSQRVFVHVPSLTWLDPHNTMYPHEYLARGVISSPAHKAIPLTAFNDIGIPISNNYAPQLHIGPSVHRPIESYAVITVEEVRNALSVAKLYGGDFVVPVVAAILSLQKRDSCLWRCGNIKSLEMITR